MTFLSGKRLTTAIKTLLKEDKVRCAVAFWGNGCEKLLEGKDARVICNLTSGGTNPHALKKLKAELKQYDALHAKVIIGKSYSIVSSANISSNGLGFEGIEQNGWHEAGVKIKTSDELKNWFDDLWKNKSRPIEVADWKNAIKKWHLRQQMKPTLLSFNNFNTDQKLLPVLDWYGDSDWTNNEDTIRGQLGKYDDSVEDCIENGCDIETSGEENFVKNRWVLRFELNKTGGPKKNSKLEFIKMSGTVIKGAVTFKNEEEASDVLLSAHVQPPIPFDPKEKNFKDAFFYVLKSEDYSCFYDTKTNCYYKTSKHLIKSFWKDVKSEVEKSKS
jgi:hypothetical protein